MTISLSLTNKMFYEFIIEIYTKENLLKLNKLKKVLLFSIKENYTFLIEWYIKNKYFTIQQVIETSCKVGNLELLKQYWFQECDKNVLFIYCIEGGNIECLEFCLQNGVKEKENALEYSLSLGNLEMNKYLIEKLHLTICKDIINETIYSENIELVKYILENRYILVVNNNKLDSYHLEHSIQIRNYKLFETILNYLDIQQIKKRSIRQLLCSCLKYQTLDIFKLFLEKIDCKSDQQEIIKDCVSFGLPSFLDYLLEIKKWEIKDNDIFMSAIYSKENAKYIFPYLYEKGYHWNNYHIYYYVGSFRFVNKMDEKFNDLFESLKCMITIGGPYNLKMSIERLINENSENCVIEYLKSYK